VTEQGKTDLVTLNGGSNILLLTENGFAAQKIFKRITAIIGAGVAFCDLLNLAEAEGMEIGNTLLIAVSECDCTAKYNGAGRGHALTD